MMKKNETKNILISIENDIFSKYVNESFALENSYIYTSVEFEQLAYKVAENPQGILILQSDKNEFELIEISKKLKRLFPEEIKIILLSSDYALRDDVYSFVDCFIQFPISFSELKEALSQLKDRQKKILIIDDSKLVHKHLTFPLQEEGYHVCSALNGEEGVQLARQLKPDLIICDIEMPKMNGFEACAAIRKIPEISNTYIIMSSTLGSAADQRRGFMSGVDEYITKPVIIPELISRLEGIFKSNLAGRENILILESDQTIIKNSTKVLTKQGFSPRVAHTLKAAYKILKKTTYDIIITEVELPDGNAIDLARSIKKMPAGKKPALLVFTTQDNQAEVKMVLNAGADGIITKPFTSDNLLANVERSVANRRAEIEKSQIEKYISKASKKMAVEKSILSGSDSQCRAYKKTATIFFSDIKDFTSRCEKYSPKIVVQQINTLFSTMTRVIMQTGGDIDKFMGDACMAFWQDDNAVKAADSALLCTIIMRNELKKMNNENPLLKDDPVYIRFGLNTGEIILADIGASEARIDLTMIGDAVNLASRFESAAKQYGVDNLVSEFTIKPLLHKYAARLIDIVKVKGKQQPVECYEMFGENDSIGIDTKQLLNTFNAGFSAYRSGNFQLALTEFSAAEKLEVNPDKLNPSQVMIDRCRRLISEIPPAWNGVWTLSDK